MVQGEEEKVPYTEGAGKVQEEENSKVEAGTDIKANAVSEAEDAVAETEEEDSMEKVDTERVLSAKGVNEVKDTKVDEEMRGVEEVQMAVEEMGEDLVEVEVQVSYHDVDLRCLHRYYRRYRTKIEKKQTTYDAQ